MPLRFAYVDHRSKLGLGYAIEENANKGILISDYINILSDAGWQITEFIDCPLSSHRFHPGLVSQMQKKRTLGVVRRTLIIAKKE